MNVNEKDVNILVVEPGKAPRPASMEIGRAHV